MAKALTLRSFLLAASLALIASPLRAAEAGDEGLPQFNTALFPEQMFWLALSFGLLFVMMSFVALPTVRRTQDDRAATIAADLAAAQAANEAAKAMMAQYEKALADARAQAQATVGEISAQAAKESAAKQSTQKQQLAKRLAEAEANILSARQAAIKEVETSTSHLADAIMEKVLGLKASPVRPAGDR